MAKIKAYLVDVDGSNSRPVEISNTLKAYYRALNCDIVDICTRKIGGRPFDIICDDEGLFVDSPVISAIDGFGNTMLVGNLLVVKRSTDSTTRGLDDDEMAHVESMMRRVRTRMHPEGYMMLTGVEAE